MYFSVTLRDKVLIQDTSSQSWHTCLRSSPEVYELHIFCSHSTSPFIQENKGYFYSIWGYQTNPTPSLSPSRNRWFRWEVQSEWVILMTGCHLNGFILSNDPTTKVKMPPSEAVDLLIKVSVAATKYASKIQDVEHSRAVFLRGRVRSSRPTTSWGSSSPNWRETRTLQVSHSTPFPGSSRHEALHSHAHTPADTHTHSYVHTSKEIVSS